VIASDGRTPAAVTLVLEPAATVSGRVVFDDRATSRPSPANVQLYLQNIYGSMMSDVPSAFSMDPDGRFTFSGVPRGHFMIGIQREPAPAGWMIKCTVQTAFTMPLNATQSIASVHRRHGADRLMRLTAKSAEGNEEPGTSP